MTLTDKLNRHRQTPAGQGGLVAVAIVVLIALVLASSTLAGISYLTSTRTVVTKYTLQTYYTAQAGIQEALATRMLPRTNFYNFVPPVAPAQAYFNTSGRIYQNPSTQTGLVGMYRYIVVGGDAARQTDGTYFPAGSLNPENVPRLLSTDQIPTTSPFIIISKATTCTVATGKSTVVSDQLFLNNGRPDCRNGFVADELTLVAEVRLQPEGPAGLRDRVSRMSVFKNSSQVRLPASVFVPGYGWTNANTALDFEVAWRNQNDSLRLRQVAFYDFTSNQIYGIYPVNGALTEIADLIPSNAVIRLYFDGAFDYRSISPSFDRHLSDCQGAGAANCRIRVMQNPGDPPVGGVAYTGNTMIPLFPGGTQVILLPPLTNTLSGATKQAIRVDASQMRTYNGFPGPTDYTVTFTTQ